VLGRTRSRTARFAALAAALTLTAASAALAAPGTSEGGGTSAPEGTAQQLETRTHQALLGLYALDSKLQAWRSRLASLEAAATALRRRRVSLRQELGAAQASFETGQHRLSLDLRALYERGNVDPVAVMLGATSLTKGLRQLDALSQVADQSHRIVDATSAARQRLLRSQRRLVAEQRRLARSLAAARQAEQQLAAAAEARLAYVSSLRAEERLRAAQLRNVVAAAQAAQQKSQQLQPPTPAPTPPTSGRQLVVSATCYDLPGKTATGMPVGRGVVAVDPSVIPLGSRLHVPGYGDGVAADVGGGIRGAVIDLWFPTYAECAAWGRRSVTITIY
jgi:3D (Asp-Asp-Asp) domain-containing protein